MLPINETDSIYSLHFLNGKRYIGKSKDPQSRYKTHLKIAQNSKCQSLLCRAIRKYGSPELQIIVSNVPRIFINSFEKYWIHFHQSHGEYGYNMTSGGDGGITYKWTPDRRDKASKQRKNKPSGATGKRWTQESKDRLSKSVTGVGNGFYKKSHSHIQKEKWSNLRSGTPPGNTGMVSITNGIKNKFVAKELLVPAGWKYGSTQKRKKKKKCPHCGKSMDSSNYKRYHNVNCSLNDTFWEEW